MSRPTILSYTIQDREGVKAVSNYYFAYDGGTVVADDLIADWVLLGNRINAMTSGVIIGGRVTIDLDPDGAWKTVTTDATQVANGAVFDFNATGTSYVQEALVPAFKPSLIVSGHPNLTDADVAAYITLLTTQVGSGTAVIFANNKYNMALVSLRDAFLNTRKHRKQLTKISLEV